MRHMYLIAVVFAVVVLAACESEPPPLPTRIPTATTTPVPTTTSTFTPTPRPTNTPQVRLQTHATNPEEQSYVRLIHAIPDLPPVTVYIDSVALAFELSFARHTEPTEIIAGDYTVSAVTRDANSEDAAQVIQQPLAVQPGKTLILILGGTADTPILGTYTQNDAALEAGVSSVALINAIPHGPTVRFQANGSGITDAIAFAQNSPTVALPSEPTTFALTSGDQILVSQAVNLREHFNYTYVAVGDPGDPATYALLAFSNRVPGFATMRIINAVADVSAVDFYANGDLLEGLVDYTRATERRQFATGLYTIAVFEAGADQSSGTPLASMEFHLNTGDNISFISMGNAETMRLVRFEDDLSPVAPDQARVVFVNSLDLPPRVRVIEGEISVPNVPDLAPQQISAPVLLDAGTRDFYWRVVENDGRLGDSVEVAPNVELSAGRSYLFLMTGRTSDAPPIIFSEVVDIDETLALPEEETTPPPTGAPTLIRVANALIDGTSIDYLVDGIMIATSLEYAKITAPMIISEGVHTISIRLPGDTFDQTTLEYDFAAGSEHTLYTYGASVDLSKILVLRNILLGDDYPASIVRLINVTPDSSIQFDLGFAEGGQQITIPTPAQQSEEGDAVPFREQLFTGVSKVAVDIGGGEASMPASIPSGRIDYYIIDTALDLVAARITDYTMQPGIYYDIIVYQALDSLQVYAQVVPYDTQP